MVAWPNHTDSPTPSVLIADDNDTWRDAVGDVLAREGFRTVEAACGEWTREAKRGPTSMPQEPSLLYIKMVVRWFRTGVI